MNKDFSEFVEWVDHQLFLLSGSSTDYEKRVLSRTVKIGEEFGELSNEIMAHLGDQRKEKIDSHTLEKLEEEFADVIITTYLLAKTTGADIEAGLEAKIKKIKERFGNV